MPDATILSELPDIIQMAIMCCNQPPKAIASEIECSVSALYEAVKGRRCIPAKVMKKFSKLNLAATIAMANQATDFKLFTYRKVDDHIQSRLTELKKLDREADIVMNTLPEFLLNKNSRNDFNSEEFAQFLEYVDVLMERDNASLCLFTKLDSQFQLNLVNRKKETASVGALTVSSIK